MEILVFQVTKVHLVKLGSLVCKDLLAKLVQLAHLETLEVQVIQELLDFLGYLEVRDQ